MQRVTHKKETMEIRREIDEQICLECSCCSALRFVDMRGNENMSPFKCLSCQQEDVVYFECHKCTLFEIVDNKNENNSVPFLCSSCQIEEEEQMKVFQITKAELELIMIFRNCIENNK